MLEIGTFKFVVVAKIDLLSFPQLASNVTVLFPPPILKSVPIASSNLLGRIEFR